MFFPVLVVLLHLLRLAAATKISPPYTATEIILLNCGASSNSTSPDGRFWDGDTHSKFLRSSPITSTATQQIQNPSIPQVPFATARIFNSSVFYIFPVSPGSKFLRLYFNPSANYSNFNPSDSFFSIKANNYTLLRNFCALLTVSAIDPPVDFLIKEFILVVGENQELNLTIVPSPNSSAFINGIEIVSMPDRLYGGRDEIPVKLVGTDKLLYVDNSYAFETVYRINVGGAYIDGIDDTGMFRKWQQDSDYIYGGATGLVSNTGLNNVKIKYTNNTPAFVAPESVYRTKRSMGSNPQVNLNYNLTWIFSVDPGFNYLIRLHFCETRMEIQNVADEVFSIFINNQTAENQTDVILLSGGNSFPVFRDYVVHITEESRGRQDLWLALHPQVSARTNDAILNGLEILKLSNLTGSLAGSNPSPTGVPPPSLQGKTKDELGHMKVIIIVGPVFFAILLSISLVTFLFICKQKDQKGRLERPKTSSLPRELCRKFLLDEIKAATKNFDKSLIIGEGGFGLVYKGDIDDGKIIIAIKRLNQSSKQGVHEFINEIEILSHLRHVNLVSLIGYCIDQGEMILVYEYVNNGTLREHLYNTTNDPLSWKQRLKICIGAACGLDYLYTGTTYTIIHRDIKTTNILLDENFVAKISDFGLSKICGDNIAVSTIVKGTWGYLDPEYARRGQLTEKSDVYSFGVVLFEVLCARKPLNDKLEEMQWNLAMWARKCIENGNIYEIIDPYLKGKISPDCFSKYIEVAESCIRDKGDERPSMRDVREKLVFASKLQDAADVEAEKKEINPVYPEVSFYGLRFTNVVGGSHEASDLSNSDTFSGITISKSRMSTVEIIDNTIVSDLNG